MARCGCEVDDFRRLLTSKLRGICELSESQVSQLVRHYRLLKAWNRAMNLTSIKGLEEIVERHYCESLFLGMQLPLGQLSVLDIGSGAGFPGIPIAVLRPDCRVTLAEAGLRKAVFLRESTRGWPTIVVFPERAETLANRFDWIVSRAVSWKQVLKIGLRLADSVGLLVGEHDAEEIQRVAGVSWKAPSRLPLGKRRMLLLGTVSPAARRVPRET